jgi:hypothetical protein
LEWGADFFPELSRRVREARARGEAEAMARARRTTREEEKASLFADGLLSLEQLARNSEEEVSGMATSEAAMVIDSAEDEALVRQKKGKRKERVRSPSPVGDLVRSPFLFLFSCFANSFR